MALMDPVIRFVGMAVLDGFTDILWMLILKDAVLLITTIVHALAGAANFRNDHHLRKVAAEAKKAEN